MIISDYIVPIYRGSVLLGTGFIVGGTLITAAHVVKTPTIDYIIIYDGKNLNLSCSNILWHEYEGQGYLQGKDNLYWDLAMYKLENVDSPLELGTFDSKFICHYQGFSINEKQEDLQIDIYNDIILDNDAWYYSRGGKLIWIDNCYLSYCGRCKEGNSGGPLFQGDKVVGMLVCGQYVGTMYRDRYIKSEYILSRLLR